MMRRWTTILTGLLLMAAGRAAAQTELTNRYDVDCLNLATGLPHNNVNQIFADSYGFVWISTYGGGAVRYDGYSFMRPDVASLSHVASNSCKGFAEDRHHRLWIAFDESTVVIDMRTMARTVPRVKSKAGQLQSDISRQLSRPSVRVYCDTKGGLWQIARDSIYRYQFDADGYVSHISSYRYLGNTPDVNVSDIDHNGTLWLNIDNGLYRLADVGGRLVRHDIAPAMTQFQGHYVTDMLKRDHVVWISTNLGLYAYDLTTSQLRSYRHTSDVNSLSHDYATSLINSPDGHLLVGTLRGVNLLDERYGTFSRWNSATPDNPLPSDFVHCMMARDGQLWIGTETAGIVKLSPKPLILRNYANERGNARSLAPHPVNAMYVEPDGTLWAGTVEGGLNRRLPDGTFEHWTTQNSALSHNSVSVLEADSDGQLWIGTWGGGLNVVTHQGARVELNRITLEPNDLAAQTNYIGALAYDKRHNALWIGSNDGIFLYHLATGRLTEPFEGNREQRGCIGAQIDRDGHLWIGCLTGVCVIDLNSVASPDGEGRYAYRLLRNKLDDPTSPVIDKISCFCETHDGTLWLGSNGYGIYRREVKETGDKKGHASEVFYGLTTDDGLANNAVKGMVEDEQGRLWITTNNGLSVYDPHTSSFVNYGERDGLLSQQYYWNSAVKGTDGAIFLGSVAGLTEIRGENTEAVYPVHLTFTRLIVDNQVMTAENSDCIDADITQATCIRLHESNKSFSLDFSALTYAGEVQGHYSYRLRGFEDEWTLLKPGEHSVRYTSLKPGSYTFEVAYTAEAVADESHVIAIQVDVAPYFWKSWWFRLLLLVALMGAVVWLYRQRLEAWRKQEAEKLLIPIRRVLDDAEDAEQLQSRIQSILDNHEQLKKSYRRSLEADKQEALLTHKTFMERATEVMERNYMNSEFGIAEFSESMGMSRSLVSKRLNAETGQSTGQFIRNYRLSIAKKLILENIANRNITEIAYKVGFNDPKYFTRCFTRQYGSSPSTYLEGDEPVAKVRESDDAKEDN